MTRTHVDRGGTFTDVVTVDDDGRISVAKVRSDEAVVGDLAIGGLTFGTTVATNALLEGRRGRTLLVTTEGFEELPWLRDMTRPELFDPDVRWPAPLLDDVVIAPGRLGADGGIREAARAPAWPTGPYDGVAIVLLHGPMRPEWETQLAETARARYPRAHVVCGHQISTSSGLLARMETALVDASITPGLLAAMSADRIPAHAHAIRSDGSLCPAPELRACDAVLSGPSGGVIAVAAIARHLDIPLVVGFDMGGTSTDVCVIRDGAVPRRTGVVRIAGTHLSRPVLEVHTIAAGGGSILHSDGLRLAVGPQSAGANPGPQCYGRGGPPTVTDAAVLEGRVDPDAFTPPLDPSRIALPETASACLAVAHEQMAQAIRDLAAQRGEDVREAELVAFGGAAGQHAADVAARCGMRRVWIHPFASVLSAFGQSLSRREEEASEAVWAPMPSAWNDVQTAWARLAARLPQLPDVQCTVELRHAGTDGIIAVVASQDEAVEDVLERFHAAHMRRFGFRRDAPVEAVDARVRVRSVEPSLPQSDTDPWGLDDTPATGPRRLDTPTTSVWIPAGWTACRRRGLLLLEGPAAPVPSSVDRTPHSAALWSARITGIARHAGHVLQRLARSVNVRERLDFSCAIFDADGDLVANAPHVPVHLGAMGATVRDLLASERHLVAGQQWVCNDPTAGGSHLPDLTVIRAVQLGPRLVFVANRAHHVDVGGISAGSMPPHSRALSEEGFVLRHVPLVAPDGARLDPSPWLTGCRQPATVIADLDAQMAANEAAARGLAELGPPEVVLAWFEHLQDLAAESVQKTIRALGATERRATDQLDGIPLVVTLRTHGDRLEVDFTGTGGPHPGNLNAPPAVVQAAVLYALRVVAGSDLPLNDGLVRHVDVGRPAPSILAPDAAAAVAGGNVETSQRLVDLLLRAMDHSEPSAGTMNNLTLGGDGWAIYETIGGGQGASARGPGASARQLHMTNTRATDPEDLERRLPVAVRVFVRRRHTGGPGRHTGGDGLVRELEVLAPCRATLLATRRRAGAGGGDGHAAPGRDQLCLDGIWTSWDGAERRLATGDRVRVETPGGAGWSPDE